MRGTTMRPSLSVVIVSIVQGAYVYFNLICRSTDSPALLTLFTAVTQAAQLFTVCHDNPYEGKVCLSGGDSSAGILEARSIT